MVNIIKTTEIIYNVRKLQQSSIETKFDNY